MPHVTAGTSAEILGLFGDSMTADHVGRRFNCTEANIIAELLLELNPNGLASRAWLWGHADGDDDSADLHQLSTCVHCNVPIRGDGISDENADTWATLLIWVTEAGDPNCLVSTGTHEPQPES